MWSVVLVECVEIIQQVVELAWDSMPKNAAIEIIAVTRIAFHLI